MLDYIVKNYSMRKTLMCGAMMPVSLLFDQPTYVFVTSNFDDDSIKNEQVSMETPLSNYSSEGYFQDTQG